ncbi:DUF3099 domain-containing protein [Ornithinimicrobium tianjinense]|uniref:DUF3099 domain-containing protein n=1 Tax=Ornithinimicrobium tianjinense TaxID=1195761 RepID=UPI00166C73D1|nr:DUF3099 domain-containing protein [Ornithinimicrobium tianjinense]
MPSNTSPRGRGRRPAQAVTTARRSQEEDRQQRMRSYLIAMGIRTLSFPVAIWAFVNHHLAIGWIFVVLAVVIPSVAVMLANAVDHRGESRGTPESPVQGLAAPTGAAARSDPAPPSSAVVSGEVVTSRDTTYPSSHPRTGR